VSYDGKVIPRDLTLGLEQVQYLSLLLGYDATPTATTDLFEFLDSTAIFDLRNNKNVVLVFDCTFEGMPHNDLLIAQSLEHSCLKYGIDCRKMFLFTGNLKHLYHSTSVNVIPLFVLDLSFKNSDFDTLRLHRSHELCVQHLKKHVLSLSRRNRGHRVWAHFMLANSEIFQDCIISQARIDVAVDGIHFDGVDPSILSKTGLTVEDFEKFKTMLPLIADGDNFHINEPFSHLAELHASTVFSIVNETLASDSNGTCLFYSEKFLKPILHHQPMLIYGQQGINKRMNLLGFRAYDTYFDLDFDDEPDDILRYKKLLASATDAVNHLRSLSRHQQIEWRFRHTDILEHNFKNLLSTPHLTMQMSHFLGIVRNITNNP